MTLYDLERLTDLARRMVGTEVASTISTRAPHYVEPGPIHGHLSANVKTIVNLAVETRLVLLYRFILEDQRFVVAVMMTSISTKN